MRSCKSRARSQREETSDKTLKELKTAFPDVVARLVDKRCWGLRAGTGTGSRFVLDFGGKVPARNPVRNPNLTRVQQRFRGEFSLFVTCAWRLDARTHVVCGWADSNLPSGDMLRGLRTVIGRRVRAINLCMPAYDLEVDFGPRTLRIFCDRTVRMEGEANYTMESWRPPLDGAWHGEGYTVLAGGRIARARLRGASTRLVDARGAIVDR